MCIRDRAILREYYDGSNKELNEARLRMAHTPEGATLVANPISIAPGFRIENVIVMAGIPAVMRAMFESVAPTLKTGDKVVSKAISVMMGEGDIAKPLREIQEQWKQVEIGSYPFVRDGSYGTTLVMRSADLQQLSKAYKMLKDLIVKIGGKPEEEA